MLFVGLVSCSPPTTVAPKAQTQNRLKNIYHALRILESENHTNIGRLLQNSTETNLQKGLLVLLSNNSQTLGFDPKIIDKKILSDGYGRRFNVEFKTNLLSKFGPTALTEAGFDVVVWSNGSNGVNENGFGDDVYLTKENRK
ncbi:MAG: hypothetical protein WCO56_07430 [Verrucomicrobiota bacterium]